MDGAAVVIPAYAAAATIARAVESAIAQSAADEIIVVDDASPDDTAAVAARLAETDARVRLIRQPANAGPAAARNAGVAATRAPWIALLDADDFMDPGRLETMIAEADRDMLDFLADDLWVVDESDPGGPRRRHWSDAAIGTTDLDLVFFVGANISSDQAFRGELGFIKPIMRRSFLEHHHLAYDEAMRLGEDYDLYARALARSARFRLVDPCGYVAVTRSDSLSVNHRAADLGALWAADTRLLKTEKLNRRERAVVRRHRLDVHKEWAWRRLIDAVKARDLRAAAGAFAAPPAVGASLAGKLIAHARGRVADRTARPR